MSSRSIVFSSIISFLNSFTSISINLSILISSLFTHINPITLTLSSSSILLGFVSMISTLDYNQLKINAIDNKINVQLPENTLNILNLSCYLSYAMCYTSLIFLSFDLSSSSLSIMFILIIYILCIYISTIRFHLTYQ